KECQLSKAENGTLRSEIDSLKLKINTASSTNSDLEKENKAENNSLNIETQRKFDKFSGVKIETDVNKSNANESYESDPEKLKIENDELKKIINIDKDKQPIIRIIEDLRREAAKYQSALGNATNFMLGDYDPNNKVRLAKDIGTLQRKLDEFSAVKIGIDINESNANELLKEYDISDISEITDKIQYKIYVKAALQRKILETILNDTSSYFNPKKEEEEKYDDLERLTVLEVKKLMELIQRFANDRVGNDDVTRALPVKLRQQIYAILGNRGFANNIPDENGTEKENQFIKNLLDNLKDLVNSIRTVKDPKKETKFNNMAPDLIRDIIRIFFFRLKVEEPMIDEPQWFPSKTPVDPYTMTGIFDEDESQNLEVKICSFPAIGYNTNEGKREILIQAKVCVN
ncbi:2872_t:CDS:2, partial [Diversispora eburnea]